MTEVRTLTETELNTNETSAGIEPYAGDYDVFAEPTETEAASEEASLNDMFAGATESRDAVITPPARNRPMTSSMLALATADLNSDNDPVMEMYRTGIQEAQDILDAQQERAVRENVADRRAFDAAQGLRDFANSMQQMVDIGTLDPAALEETEAAYRQVIAQDAREDAGIALELETVERIQDLLASGDDTEAWLVHDLFQNGNAEARMHDVMARQMIIAQRVEELQAEYENQSWPAYLLNLLTYIVPLRENFDRSGLMRDAGLAESYEGIIPFILMGNNMRAQAEKLWARPLNEFAATLARDGALMESVRSNSGLINSDPGMQLAILNDLNAITESGVAWNNLWGVVDPVSIIPFAKGANLLRTTAGLGARRAATQQTRNALDEIIRNGAETAYERTAVRMDDAIAEIEPSMVRPDRPSGQVPLGSDAIAMGRVNSALEDALPDIMGPARATSDEEVLAAYQAAQEAEVARHGDAVKDIRFLEHNPRTGESNLWEGTSGADGAVTRRIEVTVGNKKGGGFAREQDARAALTRYGREGEMFRDDSGQWFGRFETTVKEDGFISAPLETPPPSVFGPVRSAARTSDSIAIGKALQGGNATNNFNRAVDGLLKRAHRGVNREDQELLTAILTKGSNEGQWYNRQEFEALYERVHPDHAAPSQRLFETYSTFRAISDMDYAIRNRTMYLNRSAEGAESVVFRIGDNEYDLDAVINWSPSKRSTLPTWDAGANRLLDSSISPEMIREMADEGYATLRLYDPVVLPDGTEIRRVMARRNDLTARPLRTEILNYRQGGTRAYVPGTAFAKQARRNHEGNLVNPNVFIAGINRAELKTWSTRMNEAIDAFRAGERNPIAFDEVLNPDGLSPKGTPDGAAFLRMVDEGRVDTNHRISVVGDGEMPAEYIGQNSDALRFVDEAEADIEGYHRTYGRMYYSRAGEEALRDATGDFAATVDPWKTLQRSTAEASRALGMNGYRANVAERFRRTYGHLLNTEGRSLDEAGLFDLATAKIKSGIDSQAPDLAARARAEQAAMQGILRFRSEWDRYYDGMHRRFANYVQGEAARGSTRENLYRFTHWLKENNPVQALRSFAFDTKLGLFNVGQFVIQTSTMFSAMALSPKKGFRGSLNAPAMWTLAHMDFDEGVMRTMAERGTWRLGGFSSADEWMDYSRTVNEMGILRVNSQNLSQINKFGVDSAFGAMGRVEALRQSGRFFFYSAEQFNRSTASRIAWGELVERGIKPGTAKFRSEFIRLTDDYSMNMMQESAGRFQRGLVSIPTQFWAYSFRMADAMVGARFTTKQKIRLWLAQFTMAGAAGVPFGAVLKEAYESYTGEPLNDPELGMQFDEAISRGAFDSFIYYMTGADVKLSDRIGTYDLMNNIIENAFNMGEFGEVSLAEWVTGATGSINASLLPRVYDVVQYAVAESGGGDGSDWTNQSIIDLGREISTFNYAHNAYMAYNYQTYLSRNNNVLASDLPTASAFFALLSIPPAEASDISYFIENNEGEIISEAARVVTRLRQEAFTIPDRYERNLRMINTYMQLQPDHLRRRILQRANQIQDRSLYDQMARRFQEEQQERENTERVHELMNNPDNHIPAFNQ